MRIGIERKHRQLRASGGFAVGVRHRSFEFVCDSAALGGAVILAKPHNDVGVAAFRRNAAVRTAVVGGDLDRPFADALEMKFSLAVAARVPVGLAVSRYIDIGARDRLVVHVKHLPGEFEVGRLEIKRIQFHAPGVGGSRPHVVNRPRSVTGCGDGDAIFASGRQGGNFKPARCVGVAIQTSQMHATVAGPENKGNGHVCDRFAVGFHLTGQGERGREFQVQRAGFFFEVLGHGQIVFDVANQQAIRPAILSALSRIRFHLKLAIGIGLDISRLRAKTAHHPHSHSRRRLPVRLADNAGDFFRPGDFNLHPVGLAVFDFCRRLDSLDGLVVGHDLIISRQQPQECDAVAVRSADGLKILLVGTHRELR